MLYRVCLKELKKLKGESPKLDMENQLTINTSIFKENLKIISNSLIDAVWKNKIEAGKIQDTIRSAFDQIYRGSFEEIEELDEEQFYNSWINSQANTERLLSDAKNRKTNEKELRIEKKVKKEVRSLGEEEMQAIDEEILMSDIYDKDTSRTQENEENSLALDFDFDYTNRKSDFKKKKSASDDFRRQKIDSLSEERNTHKREDDAKLLRIENNKKNFKTMVSKNVKEECEFKESVSSELNKYTDREESDYNSDSDKTEKNEVNQFKNKFSQFKEGKNSIFKLRDLTKKSSKRKKSNIRHNSYRTPHINKEGKAQFPFIKEYSCTNIHNPFLKKYKSPKFSGSKRLNYETSRNTAKSSALRRSINRSPQNKESVGRSKERQIRKENSCKIIEKNVKAKKRFNVDNIFRKT